MNGFKFLLILISLTPLTLFSQNSSSSEVPFTLLPSGHILVKASVDGVEGNFIFDTGAGLTAFTKTYFQKLPHSKKADGGYTGFRATGERIDLDLYEVNNFRMGPFTKQVEEISYLDADLDGIDGIISLKSVEPDAFTIDYGKQLIRKESARSVTAIAQKASSIKVQPEESRGKALTLFAYFTVNDKLTLQFSLDSGAGKDVYRMNSKYMKMLDVNTEDTATVKRFEKKSEIDTNHISSLYLAKLEKLMAADAPTISTGELPVQFVDGLIYDGIIWINWLGSKITFDLQHRRLLVIR